MPRPWLFPKPVHPPDTWKRGLVGKEAREAVWSQLTQAQKHSAWDWCRRKAKDLERLRASVEAGTASARTKTIVLQGGQKFFATKEESVAARKSRQSMYSTQTSAQTLEFRLRAAKGCTREGCPLGIEHSAEGTVLLGLLDHDHVDPESKVGSVTCLNSSARDKELPKTQVLCCWHHFEKSRQERGDRPIDERQAGSVRDLCKMKLEVGCQHPAHASMKYAPLIPSPEADPLVVGFLDVSRTLRRMGRRSRRRDHAEQIRDLEEGRSIVVCHFCRMMITLCEKAKIFDSPFTLQQFQLLKEQSPAFVDHFEATTAGCNWEAQRERIQTNISTSMRRRSGNVARRKKQRRHTDLDVANAAYVAAAVESANACTRYATAAAAYAECARDTEDAESAQADAIAAAAQASTAAAVATEAAAAVATATL